jgi:diguanylate cyclase (GGDEF)-like protein
MVTAVVAACALLAAGVLALALRLAHVRANRQAEDILRKVDAHLSAISASVAQAIDRLVDARGDRPAALLTLDFDALVDTLVEEAAERTGADAAVLRMEGPGGRPIVAALGHAAGAEPLERALATPDAQPFRAATIEWTYASVEGADTRPFRSALVTPLDAGTVPGALAVYSTSPAAFHAEHAAVLRTLVEDASVALENARRFAEVEARLHVDLATGVPDRRGYELELERQVARARRTGRPLSVVLVGLENGPGSAGLGEMARLLMRVTRGTDISCRRGERELAVLLPETQEAGATRLTARLRDEARRALRGKSQTTFAVGHAEWRPHESVDSLDARAEAALARPLAAVNGPRGQGRLRTTARPAEPAADAPPAAPASRASDRDAPVATELRRDALDALAQRMAGARRLGRSLALVALDVDALDHVAEHLGRDVADALLADIAQRLDRAVGDGSVHRLGSAVFALLLADSSLDDAETLVGTLQASFEPPDGAERVTLTAGVTELGDGEDAEGVLGRAEHALRQARQVGPGTVVVAHTGARTHRRA